MTEQDVKQINKMVLEEKLTNLETLCLQLGNDLELLRQQFHHHGHLKNGKRYMIME